MKMRLQRIDRDMSPVEWTVPRVPSRRDSLRSRQGFQEKNLKQGRIRHQTPEEERPNRPPSRKAVYCRPRTRKATTLKYPPTVPEEESDSEFSSSEPEWSKGPFPGELRNETPAGPEEEYEPPVPLKKSPALRTLTRSLGPSPVPCKHPIPCLSRSLPNAVTTIRLALQLRPGTYVVRRSPPRNPLHPKPMKSKSDETANSSNWKHGTHGTVSQQGGMDRFIFCTLKNLDYFLFF